MIAGAGCEVLKPRHGGDVETNRHLTNSDLFPYSVLLFQISTRKFTFFAEYFSFPLQVPVFLFLRFSKAGRTS